ncbi:Branched-chain amino acid transport system permease protein livM [Granulibacter bethesdensis]|uniref:Branched-chain amino acid transport system permease protein livM n=1 Tax=Granulibacter bethesdensis TaxID=364410 RepID=A0AAC9KD25_9PROT|nr:branched-chain amino acid ABC transporter permease [Granulibacter bethesdensis]APH54787.1 Branched-chain amino acid transport system permease protein livM [Granulibacter bethesdensis]APH62373.1 Branched-chain amino acid transport system permease protein livM [Granulibacter bethesdensis]
MLSYICDAVILPFLSLSVAALGLTVVTGRAGQLSLGTGAFMAIGAFSAYDLDAYVPGTPQLVSLLFGGLVAAAAGLVVGLPSLRLRGFYLAVTTLAAQFLVPWLLTNIGWFSLDDPSGVLSAPVLRIGSFVFDTPVARAGFAAAVVAVLTAVLLRLSRTKAGRDWIAVRDMETAATVVGVPVLRTKLTAFAISSFFCGVAGVLWAFAYLRTVEPAGFDLNLSFRILFIVIIGGAGSFAGAFLGTAFMVTMPLLLSRLADYLGGGAIDSGQLANIEKMLIGGLIVLILIREPDGLSALLRPRQATRKVSLSKSLSQETV